MSIGGNVIFYANIFFLFLFLCLCESVCRYYMVTIPAVLEAGAQTKFCASLLEPNETLTMTVTLKSGEKNTTLYEKTSSEEFHECIQFQPIQTAEIYPWFMVSQMLFCFVQVQGNTFYSEEVRKVLIKAYQPMTFIQTDKPIYLPGQTVRFRVVTMDTKFRPASQLDPNNNRIGQWLNETSNSKILQLSYPLNSEAQEGSYKIIVSAGENKIQHNFKVEKYVLPKFDVTINVKEEVSVGYTYGQPVPGNVTVKACRPFVDYISKSQRKETPCDIQTQKEKVISLDKCSYHQVMF
uniref:Macroglobulin domain-containing protein n=1 Tax=Poecilia latipinna TaxID=48699 RepID=A0A3B3VSH3_9TELE